MRPLSRSLLASALLPLLFVSCRRAEVAGPAANEPALPVHTTLVKAERLRLLLEIPATVHPSERAVIASRLTGTIAFFGWGLGQPVKTGEILLQLAAPEAEARVRQAQAQVAETSRAVERERSLVSRGVNAAEASRAADDRHRFAEATLAEAEALLSYATVRAPFDGVVTAKHVLPGDLATPGLPLLALESTQRLRAEGHLPEKFSATLKIGDSLSIVVDDTRAPLSGRIEELSAAADTISRSVLAKVLLPAGAARSGQFVRMQIPAGEADALLVPTSAVSRHGQMERLFVVRHSRAVLRLVKTGRTHGSHIEILSGLNPDERLVLDPPAGLRDGAPVTIQP